jgi:hypothetical protein
VPEEELRSAGRPPQTVRPVRGRDLLLLLTQ